MWVTCTVQLLLIALSAPLALGGQELAKEILRQELAAVSTQAAEELDAVVKNLNAFNADHSRVPQMNANDEAVIAGALEEFGNRTFNSLEDNTIEEVNHRSGLDSILYEADIVLTKEQSESFLKVSNSTREKRSAPLKDSVRWDKTQPIPYRFDYTLSWNAITAIRKAIEFWEATTCLRFQENAEGANRIVFIRGEGCWSYLGRLSQAEQEVSIGDGCESVGTAAHEIAHALGFHHTHVRYDRDYHVVVNEWNVQRAAFKSNFVKESHTNNDNYGMPYEYGSVMHYGGYGFAIDPRRPTIVARDYNYEDTMGNRRPPSFMDVHMMNIHYQCQDACSSARPQCSNGGMADVNNCNSCKCPGGFGGSKCTERPRGCGSELEATHSWQTLSHEVGVGARETQMEFAECVWWIKGARVQIRIDSLAGVCSKGCGYGGIEIKADTEKTLTGYTYCCDNANGKQVTANGPIIPIIAFNRIYTTEFKLSYRLG